MDAYEIGRKAGEAARQGDWARVSHWSKSAPKPSDPDYAEYKQELRQYTLGGLGEGAETLDDSSSWHPSVRFALDEAWEALEVYAGEEGIGFEALDALEAAEEFLRGASLGMGA